MAMEAPNTKAQTNAQSLEVLISAFNNRISLLQQVLVARSALIRKQVGAALTKSMEFVSQKEKKGQGAPPRLYVTSDELESLSSYMRGRLTLEKINAAVDEMATFAKANARLLAAPRKKVVKEEQNYLVVNLYLRIMSLLFILLYGVMMFVEGRALESDMKGSALKIDNTGKAILTVLRHLGRISDLQAGRHRAFLLLKA
ncbi:hypothetical protein L7F22_030267 [Adiantum nelumboides]|nr:hypothetical protein [Adiantum nelumboides]